MWLMRFFQRIDRTWIGKAVAKRRDLLQPTGQPHKIYVENVRVFFGVPMGVARWMCDMAVREGYFEKCTGYLCPEDQRVLYEMCDGARDAPSELTCSVCEALEHESVFPTQACGSMTFYRLRKKTPPVAADEVVAGLAHQ